MSMILSNEFAFLLGDMSTLTIFPFSLQFFLQFKHLPDGGSTLCASARLSHSFYVEKEGRSKQSAWNPEQRQQDGWKELRALSRHVQCMRDFQFRDISVNNLGNSKGLSKSQSLLKFQAYGRNWKKVSSHSWMCLHLMWDWISLSDASFKLNLVSLWGTSVEKVLKNEEFLQKN